MAITSYGYDGTVLEAPWAKLSKYLGKDYGVGSVGDWLVTIVNGVDRTVKVALGDGYGRGVLDVSNSDVTLQSATLVSGVRWDTVVARRNWSTNTTTFVVVTGTATMAIAAGLNATPGTLDDQVLALVQITAGQQAPTAVVDLRTPFTEDRTDVGTISAWLTGTPPPGKVILDGRAINRVQYAKLFALWGTTHGPGDGVTTFNVPNWAGKSIVGYDATQTEFNTLGKVGGSKTHTLTAAELPAHAHDIAHTHVAGSSNASPAHSHTIGHNHGRAYGATYGGAGNHAHAEYLSDFGGLGGGGSLVRLGYNGGGGNSTGGAGAHDHSSYADVPDVGGSSGVDNATHNHVVTVTAAAGNTGSIGSGAAHNNLGPYAVGHWVVKAA